MKIQEIHKNQRTFFKTQQTKNVLYRKDSLKRFQRVLKQEEKSISTALFEDLGKPEFEAYLHPPNDALTASQPLHDHHGQSI